ncbi:MAG: RimK family alpha-L-glutamate ligase [Acidobacteria bacterium]|nr:RimK family alpha-L-glutamate ligase [Acidobacteriota bacterium]
MKGFILYRGGMNTELKLILEAAREQFIDLQVLDPCRLAVLIDQKASYLLIDGKQTLPPDFVIAGFYNDPSYRNIARLQQLETMGVFCVNRAEVMKKTGDKLLTTQLLARKGIPVPKTMLFTEDNSLSLVENEFDFPLVLKTIGGSGGSGVVLVQNKEQLSQILQIAKAGNIREELLIQEMITPSKGRDIRVMIIGGKAKACMLRKSGDPKAFRSNISCGGSPIPFEMTTEIEEMSNNVAQTLGLFLGGIDLLFGEDGFVVCEANSVPGFHNPNQGDLWGIDVPHEILRSIKNVLH